MKEILNRCFKSGMSLYSYFICHFLHNDEPEVIVQYCVNIAKINTKDFVWLIDNGYLEEVPDRSSIEIEHLKLTDKFSTDVLKLAKTKNITFDEAFEQLREHFPIKAGNSERRLQGDVARCKRLYQNTIVKNGKVDEELHSTILQCINLEIKLKTKSRSLEYFQLLATWLQQKTWELYVKDVEEIIKKNGSVDRDDNIGGFMEDV